jgi:cell division protein FtsW (lipid II flippase)
VRALIGYLIFSLAVAIITLAPSEFIGAFMLVLLVAALLTDSGDETDMKDFIEHLLFYLALAFIILAPGILILVLANLQ